MKINNYELFQVPPRWLFLKIETSEGTGETLCSIMKMAVWRNGNTLI